MWTMVDLERVFLCVCVWRAKKSMRFTLVGHLSFFRGFQEHRSILEEEAVFGVPGLGFGGR